MSQNFHFAFEHKKNNQQKQQHKNCASLDGFVWQTINNHTAMLNYVAGGGNYWADMASELPVTFLSYHAVKLFWHWRTTACQMKAIR